MKEENEITQEVKELLESLEQHGQNARRQKELSDLIDSLAAGTSLREASATKQSTCRKKGIYHRTSGLLRSARNDAKRDFHSSNDTKRRRLYPILWIVGAVAACFLFWLLAKPTMKETLNINEEILVEEIGVKDTVQEENETIEESVILEEPIIPEKLLAEETPIHPKKPLTSHLSSLTSQEPQLAENTIIETIKPEPTDTSNIGSSTIPSIEEEKLSPLTSHLSPPSSPQRRVIRSLNLVCYECQKEPEYTSHLSPLTSHLENTIFGQPKDPNMKNGSLAFEVKLH